MSNDNRYFYNPYAGDSIFDHDEIRFSDLESNKSFAKPGATEIVSIERLGGSDYSGNDGGDSWRQYRAWMDQGPPGQGRLWWPLGGGGYGSFGIVVLAAVYDRTFPEDDEDSLVIANMIDEVNGEGIADENAEYEQLYEATLEGLMEDNFTAQLLLTLVNNGGVPPPELLSAFDVEEQTVDLDEIARVARVKAKQITLTEDAAQIYHSLGDLFGIYPYMEGSGTNVNAVLSVEDWIMKFNTALVLMGEMLPFPDDENTIATTMLEKILTEPDAWKMFQYGKPFYNAIAVFNEMSREIARDVSGAKRAVQEDKYESMGLEAAIEAVLKRADTKFGAFHATSDNTLELRAHVLWRGVRTSEVHPVMLSPRLGGPNVNVEIWIGDVILEGVVPHSDLREMPDEIAFRGRLMSEHGVATENVAVFLDRTQQEQMLVWLDSILEKGFEGV